jgi:hypothetical protein
MATITKPRPIAKPSAAISPNGSIYQRYIGSIASYQRRTLDGTTSKKSLAPGRLEPASKKMPAPKGETLSAR